MTTRQITNNIAHSIPTAILLLTQIVDARKGEDRGKKVVTCLTDQIISSPRVSARTEFPVFTIPSLSGKDVRKFLSKTRMTSAPSTSP